MSNPRRMHLIPKNMLIWIFTSCSTLHFRLTNSISLSHCRRRKNHFTQRCRIHLISEAGSEDWPEMTKTEVGARLAARIAEKLKGAA